MIVVSSSVVYQSVKLWNIPYRSVNKGSARWYDAVMARPREFDTQTAIASMCDQFWSAGYEATGISDLEDATGLARARLYGAFGSKREMLCDAMDFYLESRVDVLFSRVDDSGLAGVADFFRSFAKIVKDRPDQAKMGCLVVNSMIEFGGADQEVALRADRYRDRVRGAFRSALEREAMEEGLNGDVEVLTDLAFMMPDGVVCIGEGGCVGW